MKDNIDIIIDSREPSGKEFVAGIIDAGYKPKIDFLECGDFLIYGAEKEKDAILIERKSASDFIGSMEERIWDQLKRMKESGIDERWVLVEGNPLNSKLTAYKKRGITKTQIWGAERAITNFDTRIMHVKDKDETIEWLVYLIKKQNTPKQPFTLRPSPPKSMTLRERKLYFIEGLPSIGAVTAEKLLNEFHSVERFIDGFEKSKTLSEKQKKELEKIIG